MTKAEQMVELLSRRGRRRPRGGWRPARVDPPGECR
jgi:hypothetical protein